MKVAAKGAAITLAVAALTQPLAARTRLDCLTTKVTITSAPDGNKSVRIKEDMAFDIDAKLAVPRTSASPSTARRWRVFLRAPGDFRNRTPAPPNLPRASAADPNDDEPNDLFD
jgi:hypothetical protein